MWWLLTVIQYKKSDEEIIFYISTSTKRRMYVVVSFKIFLNALPFDTIQNFRCNIRKAGEKYKLSLFNPLPYRVP